MSQAAAQAATDAATQAHGADSAFNVTDLIMTHITDGHEIEIPFTHLSIPLPQIHIMGFDLSITRHVAMMWMACAILLGLTWLAARRAKDAVPTGWRSIFEVFIKYIRDAIVRKAIGHDADRYLPYLLTCFFFIWRAIFSA